MSNINQPPFLLSFSNLISAFAGATIVSKGMDVISLSLFVNSSLSAFILGSALGWILVKFFNNKDKPPKLIEQWFSILCGLTSIILLILFKQGEIDGELTTVGVSFAFFILLSLRFSLWYYARIMRVSSVLQQGKNMGPIELGYYVAVVLGMIIWNYISIFQVDIVFALIVDIIFQFISGIIDLYAYHLVKKFKLSVIKSTDESSSHHIKENSINYALAKRLCIAMIAIVIGDQAIVFNLTHHFVKEFTDYVVGLFYGGAGIAAAFSSSMKPEIQWKKHATKDYGYAFIRMNLFNREVSISLLSMSLLLFSAVIAGIFIVAYSQAHNIVLQMDNMLGFSFVSLTTFSALLLEILIISCVTRIMFEERKTMNKVLIKKAFAALALSLAGGYFLMLYCDNILRDLSGIAILCFIAVIGSINRRRNVEAYAENKDQENIQIQEQ